MLNGKFFTGLPPKMIDRSGTVRNRMESHFFWPDDTQAVPAVETRVRRRNSFQMEPSSSRTPTLNREQLQRKSSLDGEHEVDTKQMFQKEFAKSSIQFCDNIPEIEEAPFRAQNRSQAPFHTSRRPLRKEIAAKPTATRLELPDRIVDTAAKLKQTFNSKIQFYDYVDDDDSGLNNRSTRMPKMDMNNKREVERNTKNSPKLQVKGNVCDLSATERRNDFVREQFTPDRNDFESSRSAPQRIIHNIVVAQDNAEGPYYSAEPAPARSRRSRYDNDVGDDTRYSLSETPKRILKNSVPEGRMRNDFEDYANEKDPTDLGYIEQSMRRVRVSTSPKKHVTYRDDLEASNYNDCEELFQIDSNHQNSNSARSELPNRKAGNNQRQQTQTRVITPDYEEVQTEPYMALDSGNAVSDHYSRIGNGASSANRPIKKSFNNRLNNKQFGNRARSPAPPSKSPSRMRAAGMRAEDVDGAANAGATGTQKHLRSSISFFNGAIVTDNDRTPTAGGSGSAGATARRKARSSATQRVSVGLPY